jgi:hypothetical protein
MGILSTTGYGDESQPKETKIKKIQQQDSDIIYSGISREIVTIVKPVYVDEREDSSVGKVRSY